MVTKGDGNSCSTLKGTKYVINNCYSTNSDILLLRTKSHKNTRYIVIIEIQNITYKRVTKN